MAAQVPAGHGGAADRLVTGGQASDNPRTSGTLAPTFIIFDSAQSRILY